MTIAVHWFASLFCVMFAGQLIVQGAGGGVLPTSVVALAELSAPFTSFVVLDTVAVLTTTVPFGTLEPML